MIPTAPPSKSLLSQHYLDTRLNQHPEWAEDAAAVWAAVAERWEYARQHAATWNEAQTEDEFVKPILSSLGWSFIVQTKTKRRGNLGRPDYALFGGEAGKDEAYGLQGDETAFYGRALAIAEAKYWGRPLSQKTADGRDAWKSGSNPSHQMVSYLVGTRCTWGILSNGRVWRLYSREASSTASEYYEFDLGTLFDGHPAGAPPSAGQLAQFKRWWLFFRRAAFTPDARGKTFVQRAYEGSATYAAEISDKLKELVFQEVMPEIAGGFVAFRHRQMGIQTESAEDLRLIYQASLGLLYKLLFLLYAEARGLLPTGNAGYREQSVTQLAQWAAERVDNQQPLSDATFAAPRYDALLALFRRLDLGDPSLDIPRYDGGLFDPASEENSFLERHKLSDRAVARAVDILVRDAGEPVDYAYISVRNLGAIYEGLLENRLAVVDAVAGRVELVNDKGERKATGSYYTPDYIVEYIVRHTLDPILAEREPRFAAAMDRCVALRKRLAGSHITAADVSLLRPQLDQAERDAREAFLGIKVCDPAMGSGHFLVNAVDHLTDGIIQRLQTYHDGHPDTPWEWNPIQQMVEQVRGDIVAGMAEQGINLDVNRLDDTALLTRLVMKRCIYGVDLNPMAVELAKLSLWLHSFTVGAPLSFLDHHLRWGNSLIGADVRTVTAGVQQTEQKRSISKQARTLAKGRGEAERAAAAVMQSGLFGGPFAGLLDLTAVMIDIAERADATLADVRRSTSLYQGFQDELTPYKQVLDLWVSQYFGNPTARDLLVLYGDDVLPALRGEKTIGEPYAGAIARARALWQEKRFFHWDLEFPEVFVDLQRRDWAENPGFDAVIGNPPYDELSEDMLGRKIDEMEYFQAAARFAPALGYRINLYRLFIAQAWNVTRRDGWQSFIVPLSILADRFTYALRKELLGNSRLRDIQQFPQKDDPYDRVFLDAKLSTCLYVIQNAPPEGSSMRVRVHAGRQILDSSPSYTTPQSSIQYFDPDNLSVPGLSEESWSLVLALASNGRLTRLREMAKALPGELMINRQFEPYLADDSSGEEIIRGSHIGMYTLVDPKQGEALYLNRAKYLAEHRDSEKSQHYLTKRVVYQRYAAIDNYRRLIATILPSGRFCAHTVGYLQVTSDFALEYFVALLNSKLLDWRFSLTSSNNNVNSYEINALPVPCIPFTTPAADRARLADKGRRLYEQFCSKEDYACVLGFVDHELSQAPERSDVVHDLLAFLAEQMIDMNRQKQAEMKGFLAWLERAIGAPIDSLTNKTKIQNYLGDYQKGEPVLAFDDLVAVLRQNARKLAVNPGKRSFQEEVQAEHQASLDRLLPLKTRLARTDRLIDRVVYRLYGLTEEEIAIVEGAR